MVKAVSWPLELVPQGAPPTYEAVKDRVIIVPINKGEPILFNKLAPEGTMAGMGGLLSEGKRAVSVRVDDVTGNAGFIRPGDRVDVLMTMQVPNAQDEHFPGPSCKTSWCSAAVSSGSSSNRTRSR